jgi:nicotinate-nucleotide adenylyltransferase
LREERPGDELVLLLGGDQAAALPGWREPEAVLSLATAAACVRGEFDRERVRQALSGLAGADRVEFFDLDPVPVSSTEVRRRVAAGEQLEGLVPAPIAKALSERGLYQAAVTG